MTDQPSLNMDRRTALQAAEKLDALIDDRRLKGLDSVKDAGAL